MTSNGIELAESGLLPDWVIRKGISNLQENRLKWARNRSSDDIEKHHQSWVEKLKKSPIALVPEKANEQHYEVPPSFFKLSLGENLKYSSGFWPNKDTTLNESEEHMLSLTCLQAELENGHSILELGCGWGSLTLYMASKYPSSIITAVSNSNDQRMFIEKICKERGYENVKIITADMNDFNIDIQFDRVISIEMFEHMRNYQVLLNKIYKWLIPGGKLYVHIFSHDKLVYPFEEEGVDDWMGRHFFSGGIMPSHQLLLYFQDDMKIEKTWRFSGNHYSRTSRAWLDKMDNNKTKILEVFSESYGELNKKIWFQRWRIFYMACEVLFGFRNGREWGVSHYRFIKPFNT